MTNITWTDDKRKLSQLIPWERNPRQIKGANVKRLQESFEEFGQPEPVIIGPGNELYNGHQRLKSWLSRFGDVDVAVRVASRALTEKEREKLTVYLHKGATGEFDYDILANEFEIDELLEWGFESFELGLGKDVFSPENNPELHISNYAEGDMDKARNKLDNQFSSERELISVMCPHCGGEFHVG